MHHHNGLEVISAVIRVLYATEITWRNCSASGTEGGTTETMFTAMLVSFSEIPAAGFALRGAFATPRCEYGAHVSLRVPHVCYATNVFFPHHLKAPCHGLSEAKLMGCFIPERTWEAVQREVHLVGHYPQC